MKNKLHILFCLCAIGLCSTSVLSQVWGVQKTSIGLTGGYIHSKTNGYQASLTFSDFQTGCVGYAQKGIALGTEFFPSTFEQPSVIAPKVGVHVMAFLFCLKFSGVTFLNENKIDFRLTPEIGFDLASFANITYGFAPHLLGHKVNYIGAHRLTFSVYLRKSISTQGGPMIYARPYEETVDSTSN